VPLDNPVTSIEEHGAEHVAEKAPAVAVYVPESVFPL